MDENTQIEPAILGKSKTAGSFIYSEPLKGDFAREVYNEVIQRATKDYAGVSAFNRKVDYRTFDFNDETQEIIGSSTFWNTLTDMVLRKNGLWLPSLSEGKVLDSQGRLSNGVYTDFGVVVYTDGSPNNKLARKLAQDGNKRGLKLPLVLPFSSLTLEKADNEYGIQLVLTDNLNGALSGKEAQTAINGLDYKANSSLRRLYRGRDGVWFGGWGDSLAVSDSVGRVVRFCGEAARENLNEKLASAVNLQYDSKIASLNEQLADLQGARAKAVSSIDSYFK